MRDPNPVVFLEHKHLYRRVKGEVAEGVYETPFSARIAREGTDLTVIAYGAMVHTALEATQDIDGASIEVLDLRSLVPLDEEAILASVRKTSKVVIVDEANQTCAAGAQVAALIAERAWEDLDGPVVRVSTPDVPIPFSPDARAGRAPPGRRREGGRAVSSSSTETLVDVAMPQMGVSVAEGTVVEWKKQLGDWVEADEIIASISTDKIDTDVESPATGRVQEILVEVGATVEVGTVMARIATDAKPGEAHASESDSASSGGTSEAAVRAGRRRRRRRAAGRHRGVARGHRPARLAGGAAQRRPALLAGRDADRRRARHRPRAGRGHRPRRPRAQAGRARATWSPAATARRQSRRCTSSRPTGPTRRPPRASRSRGSAARRPRPRAGARRAGRDAGRHAAARCRACASRSAAT